MKIFNAFFDSYPRKRDAVKNMCISLAKAIFLCFVFFLISSLSICQKPSFGIKLGFSSANTTFKHTATTSRETAETSARSGLLPGIFSHIKVGKSIIFRPELELVAKGAKSTVRSAQYVYDQTIALPYLSIPLNILYETSSNNKGRFLLGGGPSIGFPTGNQSYSMYDTKTEFGVNALLSYEIPIGASVVASYNYGINNVSGSRQYIEKIRNRYFSLAIGYTF